MLNSRDLSILTLAVCMYLVSNYVMMPIDNILGIPSVVLVVGLFMGILKGYSKYLLYAFSILASIPEMYIEYEKDLVLNRAFIEIYLRKLYDAVTMPPPVSEPSILTNIIAIGFYSLIFVYSIKYIYMNYKKLFSRFRLVFIMLSLPIFLTILPILVYVPYMFYFKLNTTNMLITSNIDKINWICAFLVVVRSIIVLIFGPIYGYFVFKSIGLYKRLGVK